MNLRSKLQQINYEYELLARRYAVGSETARSYELWRFSDVLLEELVSRVEEGEVLYDVGANRGNYTISAAVNGAEVESFEPNPIAVRNLRKNVALNEGIDVTVHECGLMDAVDERTFYVASPSPYSSFNEFNITHADATITRTTDVPIETVDNVVYDRGTCPPDHLKIDVEGTGYAVLYGAERTLRNHRPIIYFEPHQVEEEEFKIAETIEFLRDIDYRIVELGYPWLCLPK